MSKEWLRRHKAAGGAACLLALALPLLTPRVEAQAAPEWLDLRELRVAADAAGRTVVELDASGAMDWESFLVERPDRLVLDLPGVVSRLERGRYDVGRAGVVQVRAAQHAMSPRPVTRVVFDLDHVPEYDVERDGSRLVVRFGAADETVPPPRAAATAPPTAAATADRDPLATDAPELMRILEDLEARRAAAAPSEPPPAVASPAPEPAAAVPQPAAVAATAEDEPQRHSIDADTIDRLLRAPALAAPEPLYQQAPTAAAPPAGFGSKTIVTDAVSYSGKRISLNFVDADIKQVFRLFHEISGLNFVLDPEVTGRVTLVLDQVPWDQALDLVLKNNGLDKVLENNVLRIATTAKLAREAAARKQLKEAEELEVEPITLTRTLSYAKAADVERVIRDGGILSPRGRVIVDERTNTLIISDIPKKVDPVDSLISVLDAETPQVMIEARIVETSRNFTQDIGVTWGFDAIADASTGTATGLSFPHNASARYGLNLPGEGASELGFSFSNVVDSFTLDLALNALETEGEGRILSSPRVATQNNERAEIEQGVRIPVVNTTATEIDVEFVSASLLLAVTPQITAEGTIILDIVVENNSPDFINTAAQIPSIRTQRAQTKVLINDGGTTVIGGIFTVNEGRSEVGVPWFRKIPVFGWLFRSQNITEENRELLIFISPKIVKLG